MGAGPAGRPGRSAGHDPDPVRSVLAFPRGRYRQPCPHWWRHRRIAPSRPGTGPPVHGSGTRMIPTGHMTKRVTLANPGPPQPDGDGGYTEGWQDLSPASVWAHIDR